MRPPVRGFRPQQPRGAADPSATRPAFMNNSGSEPNSPGVTTITRPDHLWIDQLYVSPRFQRKGIGSTALRMLLSEAAAMEAPVKLSVIVTNPALDFYLRHGLRIHEQTPERSFMTT